MKLTLHVGLKKTATTTLQHALSGARLRLAAEGLLFPGKPDDPHRLGRRVRAGEAGLRLAEALAPLVAEAREAGVGHVLVSSEHLISAPAAAVEGLGDLLARDFAEATEIGVLAYVREPVGYATSMCQQGLKNGIFRLADFHADPWPFAIAAWLATYCRVFGRGSVVVRHFHPDHLAGGDILRDFLEAVGLPGVTIPTARPRRNAALSLEGAMVADALVALRPGSERDRARRGLYRRLLGKIEGSRFVLPAEVQERVIEASREDLAMLRARFGLDIRPEPVAEWPVPGITPERASELAMEILEKVEG